jgi:O-6-methylguanine DNA methyltransferase
MLINESIVLDINNYFSTKQTKSTQLTSKYKLIGTKFEKQVWREIIKIPYGTTKTYSEIAVAINKPKSYRAVANACGKNKLCLFVPCHRVTGKNNIGGYKWNIQRKKLLLEFEKKN